MSSNQNALFLLENRIDVVTPLQKSYCQTSTIIPQTSRIIPQTFVCLFSMSVMNCFDDWSSSHHRCKMVVILASLSLSLCIAAVVVIPLLSTIVVGFWPSLSLCVAVFIVASSSQDGHRHKIVIVMALMSLSLCVAVVVVVPLLSTIFFDCWMLAIIHCLSVLLLSSSRRRRKMVVVMALLSLSLCVVVVVVVPLFVNHCFCWIVGFWPS